MQTKYNIHDKCRIKAQLLQHKFNIKYCREVYSTGKQHAYRIKQTVEIIRSVAVKDMMVNSDAQEVCCS